MVDKNKTPGPVKAFYPMMVVPGMVLLLAPSTVESVMKYFHFRESLGGLLQVFYFLGGILGILSITFLARRYSVRRIAVSQVVVLSVALFSASLSPWYPLLLLFLVAVGFANGILIAFPGIYITRTCGETSHREQSSLYAFFALGVLAGPILSSLIIRGHPANWRWAYIAPALLLLPLSVPILLARFEGLDGVDRLSRKTLEVITRFDRGLFYGLFFALLLYIAAESAVSMWLITFLHREYDLTLRSAHLVLSGLWAGLTLGRWACAHLSERIDPFRILVFLSAASFVTLFAAPLAGSKTAAVLLYPLVGVFYSGIYPFLTGYVALFPAGVSSAVFSIFVAAGAAGGAVLPYFVGLINQFAGRVAGMWSICVPLLGVLGCLFWLRARTSLVPGALGEAGAVEAD